MNEQPSGEPVHVSIFTSDTAKSIDSLTKVVQTGLEWFQKHANLVTKHDLEESEQRIIAAIVSAIPGGADPAAVEKLRLQLKAATDPLKASVDAAPK